jgi:hypothetical protein
MKLRDVRWRRGGHDSDNIEIAQAGPEVAQRQRSVQPDRLDLGDPPHRRHEAVQQGLDGFVDHISQPRPRWDGT